MVDGTNGSRCNQQQVVSLLLLLLVSPSAAATVASGSASSSSSSTSLRIRYLRDRNNHYNNNKPFTQQMLLEDVALLLSSFDVTGLCHPTSDQYAPAFPKCSSLSSSSPSPLNIIQEEDATNRNPLSVTGPFRQESPEFSHQQTQPFEPISRKLEQEDVQRWKSFYGYEDDAIPEVEEVEEPKSKWFYVLHASMTFLCVLIGAIMSGLYIGLLSLDPLLLVIKSRTAKSETERYQAMQVLSLVKQRHQLIVTLLVCNCAAAEAMPIFLENLVHESLAILLSVVFVLLFGEILPTVFFTGPDQIQLASRWAPMVRCLMCVMYPLSFPIVQLMQALSTHTEDGLSGGDGYNCGTFYNRGELAALIRLQYEERRAARLRRKSMMEHSQSSLNDFETSSDTMSVEGHYKKMIGDNDCGTPSSMVSHGDMLSYSKRDFQRSNGSIDSHDVNIIEGALQLKTKSAMDVYLSYHKVFCVPHDMVVDETNIFTIYASGYSRIPVYEDHDRRRVKGILLSRQLMVAQHFAKKKTSAATVLSDLTLHTPLCVAPETNLSDLINLFQSGGSAIRAGHIALVCTRPRIGNEALERGEAIPEDAGLLGIITLEDVLEALLQTQIEDEMDASGRGVTAGVDEMSTIPESSSYHLT